MTSDELTRELVRTDEWSRDAIALGIRAGFKCEYCDLDLLSSVEAYKSWQVDHIVPRTKAEDPENLENLALACHTCNYCLKSRWNPCDVTVASASRQELISAVRGYVRLRRTVWLEKVAGIRNLVLEYETGATHAEAGTA